MIVMMISDDHDDGRVYDDTTLSLYYLFHVRTFVRATTPAYRTFHLSKYRTINFRGILRTVNLSLFHLQ
jgi:hypothetical protein